MLKIQYRKAGPKGPYPRELANAASDNERQGVVASEARWNSGAIQGVGLASLRASIEVLGLWVCERSESKVLLLLLRVKRALMRSEA